MDVRAIRLIGERLCLDFVNTVDPRGGVDAVDYLANYPSLVAWCQHAGVILESEAQQLSSEATRRPAAAGAAFHQAIALREALYNVFLAIARGEQPPARDLDRVNAAIGATYAHARIVPAGDGFQWGWTPDEQALDRVLWPIVRSAAELLTSRERRRVRVCAGATCGWLFLDTSKNGSRRWCTMDGCGNRAKARRYYARRRSGRGQTAP